MVDAMETKTSTALLEGLADPRNDAHWQVFDDRYRPIILGLAQRLGLDFADAADVAQETLTQFMQAYREGKYERERGRLRHWLMGIARNRITDMRRKKVVRRETRGLSAIEYIPDKNEMDQKWQQECRQHILLQAIEELGRESKFDQQTIEAFKMLVLEHRSAKDVAAALNITANIVYLAKHRCLGRLREIVDENSRVYELD